MSASLWPKTAPTKAEYPRYFPCPYCHGEGGSVEFSDGCGSDYSIDCIGCDGSGDGRDYVRLRDERRAKYEHDVQIMCDCGHNATEHYEGTERCAWDGPDENRGSEYCSCNKSRKTVVAARMLVAEFNAKPQEQEIPF